jgi:hypothetical protein
MAGPGSRSQALGLSLIFVSIIIGLPAQQSLFGHSYPELGYSTASEYPSHFRGERDDELRD